MADISAVYMSIDVYSSSLDKLVAKTEQAVNKLLKVSSAINGAVSDMLKASSAAGDAADKINTASIATDKATSKLTKASTATGGMINKMIKAGNSAKVMTGDMVTASKNAEGATDKFLEATKNVDELKKKLDGSKTSSEKAGESIKKLLGSLVNMDNLKKAIGLIDDYAITNQKLSKINSGHGQTDKQLQDKIYASAGRSRGSFTEMAGTVSTLESSTGNLFGSNDETLAFAELSQKAMVGDGLSNKDRTSTMTKITDSMATGSLSGDNLSSLEQSAPSIYNAISGYVGKSGDSLKTLANQGGITADVLKNAMFAASSSINGSFDEAPMTFEDTWARIKDGGLQAFSDIMAEITVLISNDDFQNFISGLIEGINLLASGVSWLINTIIGGWGIIGPILGVIATVYLAGMLVGLWALIPPLIAQAIEWLIMAAPILIIVGLIALVLSALMQLGVSWESIISVIGGVIGVFVAAFYNYFIYLWNVVAEFINFFGNVFKDPINSVKILFCNLASNVLGFILTMAQGIEDLINNIPGMSVDLTSGIENIKNDFEAEAALLKSKSDYEEYVSKKEYTSYSNAYDTGSGVAIDLSQNIQGIIDTMNGIGQDQTKDPTGTDFTPDPYKEIDTSNPVPVEGTGSNGAVNVSMEDEDLDYLRDIAERDYIANVATNSLAPNISIQFGDVHENADANKIAGRIKRILQEEIAMASEGVY